MTTDMSVSNGSDKPEPGRVTVVTLKCVYKSRQKLYLYSSRLIVYFRPFQKRVGGTLSNATLTLEQDTNRP